MVLTILCNILPIVLFITKHFITILRMQNYSENGITKGIYEAIFIISIITWHAQYTSSRFGNTTLNLGFPPNLMYCNIIYGKEWLEPFTTISFCGLTLLEGIIIMSRCTSIRSGIVSGQAFRCLSYGTYMK